MSSVFSLRPSYYEALKRLTLELAGIHLGDDHAFLVETRLSALARTEGYQSLTHLVDDLFSEGNTRLAVKVVSSLLERDTHFNPDPQSLVAVEDYLLPALYNHPDNKRIRILSFASSSGQEAYSLAIQVDKFKQRYPNAHIEIIGADYPSPAMDRAKEGRYTHFEVQRGLPIRDLITYFERIGEDWKVKDNLRSLVTFRECNLLSSLDKLGQFDLVLFRNSLSSYSSPARIRVTRSLSNVVKPEGFLMFGFDESLPQVNYGFEILLEYPHIMRKKAVIIEEPEEEDYRPTIMPEEFVPEKTLRRQ